MSVSMSTTLDEQLFQHLQAGLCSSLRTNFGSRVDKEIERLIKVMAPPDTLTQLAKWREMLLNAEL